MTKDTPLVLRRPRTVTASGAEVGGMLTQRRLQVGLPLPQTRRDLWPASKAARYEVSDESVRARVRTAPPRPEPKATRRLSIALDAAALQAAATTAAAAAAAAAAGGTDGAPDVAPNNAEVDSDDCGVPEDMQQLYVAGNNEFGQLGVGRGLSCLPRPKRVRLRDGQLRGAALTVATAAPGASGIATYRSRATRPRRAVAKGGAGTGGSGKGAPSPALPAPEDPSTFGLTHSPRHARAEDEGLAAAEEALVAAKGAAAQAAAAAQQQQQQQQQQRRERRRRLLFADAAAGGYHSLLLSSDGRLFACGLDNCHQLGVPHAPAAKAARRGLRRQLPCCVEPRPVVGISWPRGGGVAGMACGAAFSLVLTRDGVLWSFGDNADGQLGLGHRRPTAAPTRLEGLPRIGSVFAGDTHALVLTQAAVDAAAAAVAAAAAAAAGGGKPRLQGGIAGVAAAATEEAGAAAALAVRRGSAAYSWGANGWGQLGLGDTQPRLEPTRLGALDPYAACLRGASLGGCHSMVLAGAAAPTEATGAAAQGSACLLGFGKNAWGQLGLGHNRAEHVPRRVPPHFFVSPGSSVGGKGGGGATRLLAPEQVACGREHSVVLCRRNAAGNLAASPPPMENAATTQTLQHQHTDCFAFGHNHHGQLGIQLHATTSGAHADIVHAQQEEAAASAAGHGEHAHDAREPPVATPNPTLVEALSGAGVVRVRAGAFCTAAVTDSGVALTAGDNGSGQLGRGDLSNARSRPPQPCPPLAWSDHEPADIWDDGGGGRALVDDVVLGADHALWWGRRAEWETRDGGRRGGHLGGRRAREAYEGRIAARHRAATLLANASRAARARLETARRREVHARRSAAATSVQRLVRWRAMERFRRAVRQAVAVRKLQSVGRMVPAKRITFEKKRGAASEKFAVFDLSKAAARSTTAWDDDSGAAAAADAAADAAAAAAAAAANKKKKKTKDADGSQRRRSLILASIDPERLIKKQQRVHRHRLRRQSLEDLDVSLADHRVDFLRSPAVRSRKVAAVRRRSIADLKQQAKAEKRKRKAKSPWADAPPPPGARDSSGSGSGDEEEEEEEGGVGGGASLAMYPQVFAALGFVRAGGAQLPASPAGRKRGLERRNSFPGLLLDLPGDGGGDSSSSSSISSDGSSSDEGDDGGVGDTGSAGGTVPPSQPTPPPLLNIKTATPTIAAGGMLSSIRRGAPSPVGSHSTPPSEAPSNVRFAIEHGDV